MDTEFVGMDGDGDECSSPCISLLWSKDKDLWSRWIQNLWGRMVMEMNVRPHASLYCGPETRSYKLSSGTRTFLKDNNTEAYSVSNRVTAVMCLFRDS